MDYLKNIKVLELASVLAGPAVGMFFAELGAKVIKIENKRTGGDVTRSWKLPTEPKENTISAYYAAINWNKESIALDLREAADLNLLYQLVKETDIVIANYRPATAQKLGVDFQRLKAINPQLIYGNITGFGEESSRVAFDLVLQAESGFMHMNGQAHGPATKMPVALIDILAAHQLKEGLLLALLQRSTQKKAAYVSVSLLDAALSSLANQASNWLMAGHIPQRMGSLHPNIAPYGEIFESKDNIPLVLAIGNNKQFNQLCTLIEATAIANDPRFQENTSRVEHRQALAAELESQIARFEASYLLQEAEKRAIPMGQIRDMKAVFELKAAQDLVLKQEMEGQDTQRVRSAVFKLSFGKE